MKKIIFVAIVAVASLASCKKDRVCTCTTSGGGTSVKTYTKAKKADARAACMSTTATGTYGGVTYVSTTTCTLN
jgi:hypothetical protein